VPHEVAMLQRRLGQTGAPSLPATELFGSISTKSLGFVYT
jgi:hypothetical protein